MNGYTRLHRLTLEAPADMLESVAGFAPADVLKELFFAVHAVDADDPATLRWLACLCERRVADLEVAAG